MPSLAADAEVPSAGFRQPTGRWSFLRAWAPAILLALLLATGGCATPPESRDDAYDRWTRASEKMAPDNLNRGSKTIRVTTRTPPELDVRLVTFYSQFRAQPGRSVRPVPRSDKPVDGCWWSRTSLLQEERFSYSRVFFHPVPHGTYTQDVVLDEVVPGTCPIEVTGLGYEVTLRAPEGQPVVRYRRTLDIAVEEGGLDAAHAIIRCRMTPDRTGKPVLGCEREGQRAASYVGPLSTSGAALALDFRWE